MRVAVTRIMRMGNMRFIRAEISRSICGPFLKELLHWKAEHRAPVR